MCTRLLYWLFVCTVPFPLSAQVQPLAPLPSITTHVIDPIMQRSEPVLKQGLQSLSRIDGLPLRHPVPRTAGLDALIEVEVRPGVRAVEHQWLLTVDTPVTTTLAAAGIEVLSRHYLAELDIEIVHIKVPATLDDETALRHVLPASTTLQLERNYIYVAQQGDVTTQTATVPSEAFCKPTLSLGVLDTAVDTTHPVLSQAHIEQQSFLDQLPMSTTHGTAVLGTIVGQGMGLSPKLIDARVKVAAAFYTREDGSAAATLAQLLQGLNWLAAQHVAVINMSLTGPAHPLLQRAVDRLAQKGIWLVAAAGNQGPQAPPAYPAAYPAVTAVTAVDSRHRIYRWANQGDYVDVAALGVAVLTSGAHGALSKESGTSIASPQVAAALLCAKQAGVDDAGREQWLATQVSDVGAPGRDPVFGLGILTWQLRQ